MENNLRLQMNIKNVHSIEDPVEFIKDMIQMQRPNESK